MCAWGCQTHIKHIPNGEIYTAASFKTWQLSDVLLWNYAPNRLRAPSSYQADGKQSAKRPEKDTLSGYTWKNICPPPWLTLPEPSYMDINIFIEKLPLKEIAEKCYSAPGEIYFVQGERHEVRRYDGLIAGSGRFSPNYPARFMTKSDLDLSVLMSNIFVLYQLYISDRVEIAENHGKCVLRWKAMAYKKSEGQHHSLRNLPETLKQDYPILSMIEPAEDKTTLPEIPYRVCSTRETVLTMSDELREYEGTYYPGQHPDAHMYPMALLYPYSVEYEHALYVCAKKPTVKNVMRQELWVVAPDKYFSYMSRDTQRKKTDSVVRYEYFSFSMNVVDYYEKMRKDKAMIKPESFTPNRKAQLIYSR